MTSMLKNLLFKSFLLFLLLFSISPTASYAVNIYGPAPHFVVEEMVDVRTPISGDSVLIGQTVILTKPVKGDVFIIGENITIDTPINGDLRVIGSKVVIKSRVSGSVGFIAEDITITNTGEIDNDTYGITESFNLSGRVGGNLNLMQSDNSKSQIDGTVIGNVHYTNKVPNVGSSAFVGGSTTQTQAVDFGASEDETKLQLIISKILHSLSLILIAYIMWKFFAKFLDKSFKVYRSNLANNLLMGIAAVLILPLLILLSFITVIGAPIALILIAATIFLAYISPIYLAGLVGYKVFPSQKSKDESAKVSDRIRFLHIAAGIFIIDAISLSPFLGFVLYLFGLFTFFGLMFKLVLRSESHKAK